MVMHFASEEKCTFDDISNNQDEEVAGNVSSPPADGSRSASPKTAMEQEKRIRREIANSNERRRMQSINAGFQALRALLPQRDGEKLSKAAILQQTSDFIYSLEQEKARLLTQNCQLKRLLGQEQGSPEAVADSPVSERRRLSQEGGAEPPSRPTSTGGAAQPPPPLPQPPAQQAPPPQQPPLDELRLEVLQLRAQLEQEQHQRLVLEERLQLAAPPPPLSPPEYAAEPGLQVHMRFKRRRLESEPAVLAGDELPPPQTVLPGLLLEPGPMTELPPPPPPPVVTNRPLYVGSTTSRQNLDTIVEAIRHLEGDHLFGGAPEPAPAPAPQDAPLELTTHARAAEPYRPAVIVAQQPPPP